MTDTDNNDNIMALAFFRSSKDNRVDKVGYWPWEHVVEILSEHVLTDGDLDDPADKDRWMFTLAVFKDAEWPDYEPAPRKVYMKDPVTGRTVTDEYAQPTLDRIEYPENPATGRPYVQRCAANLIGYSGLLLDYDGIRTLDWAKERFGRYTYAGYTSYSHLKDGRMNKFRIVLPFREPCPAKDFELRKKAFLAFAMTDDPSTIAVSRGFYMPQVHPRRAHLAEAWSNTGEWLDWGRFRAEKPWVPPPMPVLASIEGDKLRAWGRLELEKHLQKIRDVEGEGARHHTVLGVCRYLGCVVAAGALDPHEMAAAVMNEALMKMGGARRGEIQSMIDSGIRKGRNTPATPPQKTRHTELMERILAKKRAQR